MMTKKQLQMAILNEVGRLWDQHGNYVYPHDVQPALPYSVRSVRMFMSQMASEQQLCRRGTRGGYYLPESLQDERLEAHLPMKPMGGFPTR